LFSEASRSPFSGQSAQTASYIDRKSLRTVSIKIKIVRLEPNNESRPPSDADEDEGKYVYIKCFL